MTSARRHERGDYAEAAKILWMIKEDDERLDLVLRLQRYVIRSITQCERRVPKLRKGRARLKRCLARRLAKERAQVVKDLVAGVDLRIKAIHHELFLWRCLGDGIAFIYQSKYALKHLFYDGEYRVKQGPGFISGKSGFRKEFKMLKKGIEMSVPVVLADLTNVIRHGDLCALAGPDPLIVEMKSSGNTNARMDRQISGIKEIAQFFARDFAESFRGMPNVHRVELLPDEAVHSALANECMSEALAGGWSVRHPEEGLTYLAFTSEFADEPARMEGLLSSEAGPGKIAFFLSPDESWLPAYPFSLSFTPSNLLPFVRGTLCLAVFIDALVLLRLMRERGMGAWGIMDGTWAFQITRSEADPSQGMFRVSERNFGRIGCEFQSLVWWIEAQAVLWDGAEKLVPSLEDVPYQEVPRDWLELTCCFADLTDR